MDHIGGFFQKYLKRDVLRHVVQDRVIEVCKKVLGATLPKESITLQSGVLRIRASSLLKHQIYMKKEELLLLLHTQEETKHIADIQ